MSGAPLNATRNPFSANSSFSLTFAISASFRSFMHLAIADATSYLRLRMAVIAPDAENGNIPGRSRVFIGVALYRRLISGLGWR
ncbi:hypothetical protein [Rhizobium ruizarguesonis]|uniref:hypothetical protein n=1 Tax=Rhizobium ruizarguesonis TaxID=2081791 RepID=UPI0013EED466|nr:hypothetical protein [Rhizobium ruizarguesonis]